jgi:hypothetical protein
MNNSMWWMLLPVTVFLAVAGVFYVLFPERIVSDGTMLASVLLVSLASATLAWSPLAGGSPGAAGMLGTIGISAVLSAVLLLIASAGAALAIAGVERGAMALNVVTAAGFAALLIVSRATAGTIGRISKKHELKSGHTAWAERLESIARSCDLPRIKPRLLKLAGETRFLASDEGVASEQINQRIAGILDMVADAVRRGDEDGAEYQLKRLRNLFSERESELMNLRSKV